MISYDTPHAILKRTRVGLTLIEILIALTMTLIVLGAMTSAFQYASAAMQEGRAVLEMSNRVRVAENLMRRDLANLTVEPRPYIGNAIPNGYFEYIEGPRRDLKSPFTEGAGSNVAITNSELSYLGDSDDILAMTTRSTAGSVFRGRQFNLVTGATAPIESAYAEIIWWTLLNDSNNDFIIDYSESQDLFRRVLLINPELNMPIVGFPGEVAVEADLPFGQALEWLALSDISARLETAASGTAGNVDIVANSLQDLASRQNRAFRSSTVAGLPFNRLTFPHALDRTALSNLRASDAQPLAVAGVIDFDGIAPGILPNGNDRVVENLAAFDVRVFASNAFVSTVAGVLIEPSDPQFNGFDGDGDGIPVACDADDGNPGNTSLLAGSGRVGAYVDLGHHGGGQFSQALTPTGFFSVTGTLAAKSPMNYQFLFEQLTFGAGNPTFPAAVPASLNGLLETVYDTWTPAYESDGIDQDNAAVPLYRRVDPTPLTNAEANIDDQGTNGIDDDGDNGPDDYNERETQPPYPDPISGLKVTFRLIEKQTGEIRQSSVVHDFDVQ